MKSQTSNYLVIIMLLAAKLSPIFAQDCDPAENPKATVRSAENPKATVRIDTDAPLVVYSPMIFGGFLEHFNKQVYGGIFDPGSPLSDERGFRTDVIAALKELKVPVMRWPGGCYVYDYDWQDGIGKNRQPTRDTMWGVMDPHTFGTDEFVDYCRIMGWEPYICTNHGNPVQDMTEWVAYCNLTEGSFAEMRKTNGYPEPRNVKIWSVGNEAYQLSFIPTILEAAKAMKAVDPTIKVTCPAQASETVAILEAAGEYLDYLSIHYYWIPNYQEHQRPDYLTCMMNSEHPENVVRGVIGAIDQTEYRGKVKISFDEWNLRSWHHPGFPGGAHDYESPETIKLLKARDKSLEPSLYTMADALFAASFFNACLRHAEDVGMAAIAPLVNQTGPLYVHPKGIVKRTHFHTMAMYANQLGSRVGKLDLKAGELKHNDKSVSVVDAIATVDESGKTWSIALVNRHPSKNVACTMKMKDTLLEGAYPATILTGDSPDAYNDIEHPDRVVPKKMQLTFKDGVVDLPPHSLTIVTVSFEKAGAD